MSFVISGQFLSEELLLENNPVLFMFSYTITRLRDYATIKPLPTTVLGARCRQRFNIIPSLSATVLGARCR
jgi:hypothetical protein